MFVRDFAFYIERLSIISRKDAKGAQRREGTFLAPLRPHGVLRDKRLRVTQEIPGQAGDDNITRSFILSLISLLEN